MRAAMILTDDEWYDRCETLFDSVTYITCPADPDKTLAIKLPFLILVIKNMKKYFTFEVQVDLFSSVVSGSVYSVTGHDTTSRRAVVHRQAVL